MMIGFNKVVIWGHKLHSHTHSYIHAAYHKAFMSMGYETLWLDKNDDVSGVDFSNSLFLTEGQVDSNIPMRNDCTYVLHNCNQQKYSDLKCLNLQVYSNGFEKSMGVSGTKIDQCVYYDESIKTLYQPWATDLLPDEIGEEYRENNNKKAVWIGSVWGGYHGNDTELIPFVESCKMFGYDFVYRNPGSSSFEENREIVLSSDVAPAIVGRWQKVNGYIPCRIFKNISYGRLGLTNSSVVYDLLEGNTVCNSSERIMEDYLSMTTEKRKEMYRKSVALVKEKHTYLNRINTILSVM